MSDFYNDRKKTEPQITSARLLPKVGCSYTASVESSEGSREGNERIED
jgi:hypothetical protein